MAKGFGDMLGAAIAGLSTLKEVAAQKGREGKQQLDRALVERKRRKALERLGTRVVELVERGRLDPQGFEGELDAVAALDDELARVADGEGGFGGGFGGLGGLGGAAASGFGGAVSAFGGKDPFRRHDTEDEGDEPADLAPARRGDEGHVRANQAWERISQRAAIEADDLPSDDDEDA